MHSAGYTPRTSTGRYGVFRVIRSYLRLPPQRGGMEMHIARLSEGQRDLGIDVINLFNVGSAAGASEQILPNYDLSAIRPACFRSAIFSSAAFFGLKHLQTTTPTILHVHGDAVDFMFSKALAKKLGAQAVAASIHDSIKKNIPYVYAWSLSHCDPIFVTGKGDQLYLEQVLNRPVYHLPSAPADLFFDSSVPILNRDTDVISVANFVPKKGIEIILECAAKRRDRSFVVIGDGPIRSSIISEANRRNLSNVSFPGLVTAGEVADALRRSKIFLSTAYKEGTPTAALEAMAIGLPLVLTPSNNYEWLMRPEVNGFITPDWDVNSILYALDRLLNDDTLRCRIGATNREAARQHTWSNKSLLVSEIMWNRLLHDEKSSG